MELKITYSENQNDIDSYEITTHDDDYCVLEIKGWIYDKHRYIDGFCEEDTIEEGTFEAYKKFIIPKTVSITDDLLEKYGYACGMEWFPNSGYGTGRFNLAAVYAIDNYLTLYIATDENNKVTDDRDKIKYCYSFNCKFYVDGKNFVVD